jgi:hypothetical protein
MILLLILLFLKHFIVDFPLQAYPYQYKNKGTYGHPGGLLHSGLHVVATFLVVYWFVGPIFAIGLSILDGIIHYHIDWAKVKINTKMNLTPVNSEKFWVLLGVDQLLHSLTYLLITYLVFQ